MDFKNETRVNKVLTTGRVISIRNMSKSRCIVTVLSRNGRDIYPRFLCDISKIPPLQTHARVMVEGHFESYRYKDKEDGKWKVEQRIIADSIEPAITITEEYFGEVGKFFAPLASSVFIKGVVTDVKKTDNWYKYNIDVSEDDSQPLTIQVSMKELDRHPDIKKYDTICAVCGISTPQKVFDNITYNYENIVVSDVAVIHHQATNTQ